MGCKVKSPNTGNAGILRTLLQNRYPMAICRHNETLPAICAKSRSVLGAVKVNGIGLDFAFDKGQAGVFVHINFQQIPQPILVSGNWMLPDKLEKPVRIYGIFELAASLSGEDYLIGKTPQFIITEA